MLNKIMLFFVVFYTTHVFAENTQPAVAIKEPTINEGISKYYFNRISTDIIRSEMEASFIATRKFRVLSRNKQQLKAVRDEQNFAQTDLAKADAATTGDLNNAHYLIIPSVQDFKLYRKHVPLPNFDSKFKRRDYGLLDVNAQMIDTSSGQIVTTFSLKTKFASKEKIVNEDIGYPSSEYFTSMAKKVAAMLADQFIATVYPMKVIKRTKTNQIIINRGKDGGLKKGDQLNVYFAGEELIDPDTGESLGSSEEFIGTVKVTRINPKITYAKIASEVDSENAPITIGNILRKQ